MKLQAPTGCQEQMNGRNSGSTRRGGHAVARTNGGYLLAIDIADQGRPDFFSSSVGSTGGPYLRTASL